MQQSGWRDDSDSATYIGSDAFGRCVSLTTVMIGDSVTNIGYGAFANCDGLRSVLCKGNVPGVVGDAIFSGSWPTVYRRIGAVGWGATFAERSTALWPEMVRSKATPAGFRLDIAASEGQVFRVEVCTNLLPATWTPIVTNTIPAGELFEFVDSQPAC
ncbi:MAG: leucine-rich repeat domain-containing protein, partial [Verrucomicrobia bacterium]|nr:leucine-rich repeat domain-containing protein [Verrucomicrobiota bacterium]